MNIIRILGALAGAVLTIALGFAFLSEMSRVDAEGAYNPDAYPISFLPAVLDQKPTPVPTPTPTPAALFVGLENRWDGEGYLHLDNNYFLIGSHLQRVLDQMTDTDVIRSSNRQWYAPNPGGWEAESWYSFYSVSTGHPLGSSVPSDPAWKWGYHWVMPYSWQFADGQTTMIDGQVFVVSGPFQGHTAFGRAVNYWHLVNKNAFLYFDDGSDPRQYVHAGEAILQYDAGSSRLWLYSDIMRRVYEEGKPNGDSVQYIQKLTYTNAPGLTGGDALAVGETALHDEVQHLEFDGMGVWAQP